MKQIKNILGAALLCITSLTTFTAKADPPCCLFIISAGPQMAAVTLNGVSLINNAQSFKEGDIVSGSYAGCPPGAVVVAYLTGMRWNNVSKQYDVVSNKQIILSSSCESGTWTLHCLCEQTQQGCEFIMMNYTQDQLYCPCGS